MKKKKGKGLQRILAMAFTFVMVFAGFVGKMDVHAAADSICKVSVVVKDKETGEIIPGAQVIFTEYYRNSSTMTYPEIEVTQNEDGTYNVPYDSSYGTYYRYYATAAGYYDSRTPDGKGILYGAKATIDSSEMTLTAITLEKFPPTERLQQEITSAENEINGYLDQSKYDAEEIDQINTIINEYKSRINEIEIGEETETSADEKISNLKTIVEEAKKALDGVTTSQSKRNEEYANLISFQAEGKEPVALERTEYGKFKMTVGLFDKGGLFQVTHDEDTTVTWNATEKQFSIFAGSDFYDVPYITSQAYGNVPIGSFLCDSAKPDDTSFRATTISNASVTFTSAGKEVTVTFDLVVEPLKIEGIVYSGPTSVELTRDEDGYFNTAIALGTQDGQYSLTVKANDSNYKADVTVESLTPSIADLNKKDTIIPKKTGTARFKATSENCEDFEFEITFVLSQKEQQEIADAQAVDQLIGALGDITLAKESEVQAVKDAYDKLSDDAKKKVSKLDILTAAEKKVVTLKAQEAESKAQESEKKAQEAESKAQESEKKAQEAESKAQTAEKKAAALQEKITKQQLTKITLKATAGKKKVKLTWKKNSKATGYVIYRATKKNGKYTKIKVIKNWKTNSFTDKKLKSGKKYYYKICAYKGNVTGTLSNAKLVKVK